MLQDLRIGWSHSASTGTLGQFCPMNLILRLRLKRKQLFSWWRKKLPESLAEICTVSLALRCHFKEEEANSVWCQIYQHWHCHVHPHSAGLCKIHGQGQHQHQLSRKVHTPLGGLEKGVEINWAVIYYTCELQRPHFQYHRGSATPLAPFLNKTKTGQYH